MAGSHYDQGHALKITASKDVVIPVERVLAAGSHGSIVGVLADNRVEVELSGIRALFIETIPT